MSTGRTSAAMCVILAASGLAGCQADRLGTSDKARDRNALTATRSTGAGAAAQTDAELAAPLATVDGLVITLGDFQAQLGQQSAYVRARYASLEQKKEFLDTLIKFELLAKEALRRGFDKDPEVVRSMKQVMIQKLLRDEFETKLTPDSIYDADIKAYYEANLAEYVKPAEVRASAIIVKSKAQADRIVAEAKGEAGRTNKGFRDLVGKYSIDDEFKLRGGDLRYFAADHKDLPAAVVAAAFALPTVGAVSDVVDGKDGKFYILKQTGTRKASTKSLADATPTIRNKLYRDKRVGAQTTFVADLRSKAKVEINEANLGKVRVDTTATAGGPDPHGHLGAAPMTTGQPGGGLDPIDPEPAPLPAPGPMPGAAPVPGAP
jgi:peptidyl-prolyl cis-trans isomerase C